MLSNVILGILAVYVCVTPYFYAKAVKFGVKMATKPEETAKEPVFNVKMPKKAPKRTPEQDRNRNSQNKRNDSLNSGTRSNNMRKNTLIRSVQKRNNIFPFIFHCLASFLTVTGRTTISSPLAIADFKA